MLALLYGGRAAVLKARLNMESLIRTIYLAANDLVAVYLDIFHEFTGQARNRKFIYQNYTRLFTEAEEEAGA